MGNGLTCVAYGLTLGESSICLDGVESFQLINITPRTYRLSADWTIAAIRKGRAFGKRMLLHEMHPRKFDFDQSGIFTAV
jgi:hypothetical protein